MSLAKLQEFASHSNRLQVLSHEQSHCSFRHQNKNSLMGIFCGHKYFYCRHNKNFSTPTRGFCCYRNIATSRTSTKKSQAVGIFCLVRERGLEPPRPKAHPPQGCLSTVSTLAHLLSTYTERPPYHTQSSGNFQLNKKKGFPFFLL